MNLFTNLINSKIKLYSSIVISIVVLIILIFTGITIHNHIQTKKSNEVLKVENKLLVETNKNNSQVQQNKEQSTAIISEGISENIKALDETNDIKESIKKLHTQALSELKQKSMIDNAPLLTDNDTSNDTIVVVNEPKEISDVSKKILAYEKEKTDPIIDQLGDL